MYCILHSETTTFASISGFRLTDRTTLAATRHIHKCLRPRLGRKHIFGVFRAQETCRVAANVVSPVEGTGTNRTSPNPAWRATSRGRKRREEREEKGKEGNERNGWEKNTASQINIWLRPWDISFRTRRFWVITSKRRPPLDLRKRPPVCPEPRWGSLQLWWFADHLSAVSSALRTSSQFRPSSLCHQQPGFWQHRRLPVSLLNDPYHVQQPADRFIVADNHHFLS